MNLSEGRNPQETYQHMLPPIMNPLQQEDKEGRSIKKKMNQLIEVYQPWD